VSDRRTFSALPGPVQSGDRAEHLLLALAHVLARSSGATVPFPRQLAGLLQDELQRLTRGLWSAQDVARFLGVHRNWVYLQAEAGSLPCVRVGGLVRFDPEVIRAIGRGEQVRGGRVIAVPVARKRNERK
jgi:excisionase family DNA binding protein